MFTLTIKLLLRLNTDNVQLLDSTRIHPETYIWATKMAIDALEYDDDEEDTNIKQRAIEETMEDPEKLRDLDLDAFAIELERQVRPILLSKLQ